MARYILCCGIMATLFLAESLSAQDTAPMVARGLTMTPAVEISLWNGAVPGEKGNIPDEVAQLGGRDGKENPPVLRIENVSKPMLSLFPSTVGTAPVAGRPCVVIFPGGGYNILAYNHEGVEVADWLNSLGISAVVCKYRVPRRADMAKHIAPLQDAQRCIRLVRHHAKEWGIDSQKIGVMGFSAGGHLTIMAATAFNETTYPKMDEADDLSCRPDFALPIYPAYIQGDDRNTYNKRATPISPEIKITKEIPPFFMSITDDDWVAAMGPAKIYLEMRELGVPCELHIFVKGGHGYGMRPEKGRQARWNELAATWLADFLDIGSGISSLTTK